MKRKNIIFSLAVILSLVFTSCEKVLDVVPEENISNETALTTEYGLQTAVIGAYDRMQSGYLYGGRIWVGGDMLADNVKKSGDYALVYEEIQFMEKNLSPDNLITSVLWSDGYYVINLVNNVLQAIPEVFGSEVSESRQIIEGECRFIRAMVYFDMTRYFCNPEKGLAVPLLLSPSAINSDPPRANTENMMAQIIEDLEMAIELLPASNNDRATSLAANALLSRVLFYHGDYAEAAGYATTVIESGEFALVDSVLDNYTDGSLSSEVIFAMMSTDLDPSCGTLNGFYRKESTPRFSPSNDLLKIFLFTGGLDDQRYTKLFTEIEGKVYTTKFDNRYMNVPLIRLAEVYLTRAECRYELDDIDGCLADYNMVREKRGLEAATSVNMNDLFYERAKELVFEGDNFFNQKRLQKNNISKFDLPWDSPRLMYKIPQREIDVNPNLEQN